MISALYVETEDAYFGLTAVDPWDEARDARRYTGPLPVVAHPPCQALGPVLARRTEQAAPVPHGRGRRMLCRSTDRRTQLRRGAGTPGPQPRLALAWPEGAAKGRRVGRATYSPGSHGKARLREGAAHWNNGDGGGKDKTRFRNATPPEFRDLLLEIAGSAAPTSNLAAQRRLVPRRPLETIVRVRIY